MNDLILANIDRAKTCLEKANTLQEVKEIIAMADAAKVFAKRIKASIETVNYAGAVRLRAERKLGEMLSKTELAKGGQPYQRNSTGSKKVPVETLKQAGIQKKTSSRAQCLAQVSEADFEAALVVQPNKELNPNAVVKQFIAKARAKERQRTLKTMDWPKGKYRVLYADPPWQYGDARLGTVEGGGATGTYDTMSLKKICKMRIADIALPESVLFLWVTSPMLPEGITVMSAWGFTYKASFVWDKVRGFNGHYNDVIHELLLLGTRRSCLPESESLTKSIIRKEKGRHSVKPDCFRELIDALYPSGPRIELFARTKAVGWDWWGNEI